MEYTADQFDNAILDVMKDRQEDILHINHVIDEVKKLCPNVNFSYPTMILRLNSVIKDINEIYDFLHTIEINEDLYVIYSDTLPKDFKDKYIPKKKEFNNSKYDNNITNNYAYYAHERVASDLLKTNLELSKIKNDFQVKRSEVEVYKAQASLRQARVEHVENELTQIKKQNELFLTKIHDNTTNKFETMIIKFFFLIYVLFTFFVYVQ